MSGVNMREQLQLLGTLLQAHQMALSGLNVAAISERVPQLVQHVSYLQQLHTITTIRIFFLPFSLSSSSPPFFGFKNNNNNNNFFFCVLCSYLLFFLFFLVLFPLPKPFHPYHQMDPPPTIMVSF